MDHGAKLSPHFLNPNVDLKFFPGAPREGDVMNRVSYLYICVSFVFMGRVSRAVGISTIDLKFLPNTYGKRNSFKTGWG